MRLAQCACRDLRCRSVVTDKCLKNSRVRSALGNALPSGDRNRAGAIAAAPRGPCCRALRSTGTEYACQIHGYSPTTPSALQKGLPMSHHNRAPFCDGGGGASLLVERHEMRQFNNLLTVIRGRTELALLEISCDHPARHYLQQVVEMSQRAERLVQRMFEAGDRP